MNSTKSIITASLITTVAVGSLIGIGAASAHNSSAQDSIVDKIATKFNLNRDEVATVFEEVHEEHHAEMEAKHAEHLQSLVDNGTLTEEQKTALEAKHDEMESTREELKNLDLTSEQMREKMEAARDEFESWAQEQGIDLEAIKPEGGMKNHGGFRGHGMHGGMSSVEE